MPAIIKKDLRVENLNQFINSLENKPTYVYISRTTPWADEQNPPIPNDSVEDEYNTLNELIGLKKINRNDAIAVLPRTDWTSGTVYDHYDQKVDLVNTRNPETGDFWRFYVVTEDFNVYKCLSNNYRVPSVDRPTGTNPSSFQTPDGYIWKYMYTIQASDAFKFMTSNWMPCYTLTYNDGSPQWNSQQNATSGTIDNIIVTNKGTGYDPLNPPTINIIGDGFGATATPVIDTVTGELNNILVTNTGSDYTSVTIQITDDGNGLGAEARGIIGPRMGHGSNPKIELGAFYLMLKTTLDGSENSIIQTGLDYRVSGVIQNPKHISNTVIGVKVLTSDSYLFKENETVTGEASNATGLIQFIDKQNGIIYLTNVSGSFIQSENISSNINNLTQIETVFSDYQLLTDLVYDPSTYNQKTGNIFYIANREFISRVDNQKEDIIAIITF